MVSWSFSVYPVAAVVWICEFCLGEALAVEVQGGSDMRRLHVIAAPTACSNCYYYYKYYY